MDELFDGLSRKLASTMSRRSALGALFAAFVLGEGCISPTDSSGSGDSCSCDDPTWGCCVRHGKCCPPEAPHHCQNTSRCYQFFTGAQAACGNDYEICGGQVG